MLLLLLGNLICTACKLSGKGFEKENPNQKISIDVFKTQRVCFDMQKIRPSESAIEQCTLQLARYVYLEPKFPIFWIILEDLSQKMEGQPPKKEVSGVLGIHIIHYILHHGVRISFNLASKTPARSVMKEKDEGVPTDVSVCVCVSIFNIYKSIQQKSCYPSK